MVSYLSKFQCNSTFDQQSQAREYNQCSVGLPYRIFSGFPQNKAPFSYFFVVISELKFKSSTVYSIFNWIISYKTSYVHDNILVGFPC